MNYPVIDTKASGAQIKALRLAKGLTVREVQAALGFEEPQSIYKWERGASLPSTDNLLALSLLLEIPIEQILIYHK